MASMKGVHTNWNQNPQFWSAGGHLKRVARAKDSPPDAFAHSCKRGTHPKPPNYSPIDLKLDHQIMTTLRPLIKVLLGGLNSSRLSEDLPNLDRKPDLQKKRLAFDQLALMHFPLRIGGTCPQRALKPRTLNAKPKALNPKTPSPGLIHAKNPTPPTRNPNPKTNAKLSHCLNALHFRTALPDMNLIQLPGKPLARNLGRLCADLGYG